VIEPVAGTVAQEAARVTPHGLQIPEGISFKTWTGMGLKLLGLSNAYAWCLGDWVIYGEQTYGQRYRLALDTTALDYQTLRNYAWVARRFDLSRRRDTISFQHHAEVAALSEPEQELWLTRAERARWSRNELRRRLQASRRPNGGIAAEAAVKLQVEVTKDRERRWRDAASAAAQTLPEWIATAVDAAADALLVAPAEPLAVGEENGATPRAHALSAG
jgi:hypothetical protein